MKKIIISTIALSLMCVQAAFAQNMGALSSDAQPQRLISASEFTRFLAEHHDASVSATNNLDSNRLSGDKKSNLWGGFGCGGFGAFGACGLGGLISPYAYLGFGSFFPSFGCGLGLGLGGFGFGVGGFWLDGENSDRPSNANAVAHNPSFVDSEHPIADAAHVPVACFASDSHGNWFGAFDVASNVEKTQHYVNSECSDAGGTCVHNLGCALAVPQE